MRGAASRARDGVTAAAAIWFLLQDVGRVQTHPPHLGSAASSRASRRRTATASPSVGIIGLLRPGHRPVMSDDYADGIDAARRTRCPPTSTALCATVFR